MLSLRSRLSRNESKFITLDPHHKMSVSWGQALEITAREGGESNVAPSKIRMLSKPAPGKISCSPPQLRGRSTQEVAKGCTSKRGGSPTFAPDSFQRTHWIERNSAVQPLRLPPSTSAQMDRACEAGFDFISSCKSFAKIHFV